MPISKYTLNSYVHVKGVPMVLYWPYVLLPHVHVEVVLVVNTEFTSSWDLGIRGNCKHDVSIKFDEKLASIL